MKQFISLLLCLFLIAGLTACGGSSGGESSAAAEGDGAAASDEKVELTIWVNGKDSYISPDEQKKPEEEWYFNQAIARFEEKYPNISVKMIVSADGETAHQQFKADELAGTAPDMANLWTGQYSYQLEDACLDIKDLIPPEDKENIMGWDAVTTPSGKVLGYPTSDNQVCFFMYNKQIIEECGLDFENNPPRTLEEFDAACEVIKGKGYTPIVTDEGAFPWFGCFIMNYWWAQLSTVDRIVANCDGSQKFADDEGLFKAAEYYRSLMEKGYINEDALTCADSFNRFTSGQAAMTPQVSSAVGDAEAALGAENLGAILPPDMDGASITGGTIGGPGQDIVVSASTKHPKECIQFLSYLNSKEEIMEFEKVQTKVSTRKDVTAADLNIQEGSTTAKLFEYSNNMVFWIDNTLTSDVCAEYTQVLPLVLGGQMTIEDFAAALDNAVG